MINQRDKDGKYQGHWELYYTDGGLAWTGEYKNGKRHGPWEEYYHDNGQLDYKGEYKSSKRRGLFFIFRYIK